MSKAEQSSEQHSGTALTDYRLLKLVGQGQFAQVYFAIHRHTGQLAAIKQTRHAPQQASQEPFILAEIHHPNLVNCRAIVQTDQGYRFVLEYCEGGTLRSHLTAQLTAAAPLASTQTKSLITNILQGLSYLHQQGIIHNDLKPENILLTHSEQPLDSKRYSIEAKIGDFGSARFIKFPSRSHREIGSPTYAAPERFNGQSSIASDLYSVGVITYEMLLGDRPFSGSPSALLQAHQHQPIPLPDTLSPALRHFFSTALHKQPEHRFPSANAMLAALHSCHFTHQATIQAATIPTASVSQTLLTFHTIDILDTVEELIAVPQGCYIVTQKSLHFISHKQQLSALDRFKENVWTAIDPYGNWFVTLPHQPGQAQFYSFCAGKAQNPKPISLTSSLRTALRSKVVQLLAVSSRHLIKIRASQSRPKTYFELFTRKGQLLGQLTANLSIAQAVLTAIPYQLIARTAASKSAESEVVLITLNPFQIKHLGYQQPQQISTLPWGNIIGFQHHSLLLDRSADPVSALSGLPPYSAIASLGDRNLLIATTSSPPTLLTADLKEIDLGLIF